MKKRRPSLVLWTIMLGMFLIIPQLSIAKETPQQWELVNPSGVIEVKYFQPAPRLTSLDGKTIVLRWNEKHNGDNLLNRVAELLKEKAPTAKLIKLYDIDKSTVKISGSASESVRIAKVIKELKADIVIASQAD